MVLSTPDRRATQDYMTGYHYGKANGRVSDDDLRVKMDKSYKHLPHVFEMNFINGYRKALEDHHKN